MEDAGQPSLTEFLLDLSDSEELYDRFWRDRDALIREKGLEIYRDLLVREPNEVNIQGLRDAVRAEVIGRPGNNPPGPGRVSEDDCIIYGIRKPPGPPPH